VAWKHNDAMNYRLLGILLASMAIAARPVAAFDGKEHRHVSAAGFQLALEACDRIADCKLTPELRRETDAFVDPHSRLEYGTIVSSVDYRINPLQILQATESQKELPSNPSRLDPHLLGFLTRGGTWFFRAAAANDTHFQGELIAGIRNWHAYAVDVAAQDRNLFAALVINSISDHFLQDFFAPGHIVTPRFGLHDAAAMALHNRYNYLGSTFVIEQDSFQKDLGLLLELFLSTKEGRRFVEALPTLREVVPTFPNPVPLWGDSNLFRSPSQELLMILVEARSILDILQSASSGKRMNKLTDVAWVPTSIVKKNGRERTLLAGGKLPYGEYRHLVPEVWRLNGGTILGFSAGTNVLRVGQSTRTRGVYQGDVIVYGRFPLKAEPNATDLNAPAIAHFRDGGWSIRAGYTYEQGETDLARGPSLRFVYTRPLIHMQVSADAAWKSYHLNNLSDRKLAYGARFQTGFSMLMLDIGMGRDYSWTLGRLKPALATRFGLYVPVPLSSIPKLGSIEQRVYRWQRRRMENRAAQNQAAQKQ
jgi:hypothetical protein